MGALIALIIQQKYRDKYLDREARNKMEEWSNFGVWLRAKVKPQLSACSAVISFQQNFASGKCKKPNNSFVLYHHWQTWKTTHFSSISLHLIIMYGSNLSFPFYFCSWRIYQNVCRKIGYWGFFIIISIQFIVGKYITINKH